MIKEMFRYDVKLYKMIQIFISLLILFCGLMILVYCIPEERIRFNIAKSVEYMNEEKCYPYMGVKDVGFALDNYTEASLLNFMYIADNERPIYSAFVQQEYFPEIWFNGLDCLNGAINEFPNEMSGNLTIRPAYWIGYSVILRPLLYFTDYYNIRSINNILAMVTLVGTCILISKKLTNYIAMAFAVVMNCFNYYVLSLNITLGIFCIYTLLGVLVYILKKEGEVHYGYTMLVVGMVTAFFEWFSIPYITYGMTVLFLLYLRRMNEKAHFAAYFNIAFQSGVSWCIGYGSTVLAKSVIASVVLKSWDMTYFIGRLSSNRYGGASDVIEFVVSLKRLVRLAFPLHLFDDVYNIHRIYIAIVLLGVMIIALTFYKEEIAYHFVLVIIAVSPILWYLMFKGHMGHSGIDYRTLMVSGFAFLLMAEKPLKEFGEKLKKIQVRDKKNKD